VLFTGSGGGCHVRDFAPYSEGSVAQGSPPIRGNGFRVGNMKKVRDLVMDGQEPCACRADLKRFMIRSRRRVGW
jgi:hypothetical protein